MHKQKARDGAGAGQFVARDSVCVCVREREREKGGERERVCVLAIMMLMVVMVEQALDKSERAVNEDSARPQSWKHILTKNTGWIRRSTIRSERWSVCV